MQLQVTAFVLASARLAPLEASPDPLTTSLLQHSDPVAHDAGTESASLDPMPDDGEGDSLTFKILRTDLYWSVS